MTRSSGATLPEKDKRDAEGEWGGRTKGVGAYADVNGINLYCEIHGTGRPLILLHGGLGGDLHVRPEHPGARQRSATR